MTAGGKVVVVTAHFHADNVPNNTGTDEEISVSITDHKHQTGPDRTMSDADPLNHDGEDAYDLVAVAEHTHDEEKNKITIDVLAHKHQTGAASGYPHL